MAGGRCLTSLAAEIGDLHQFDMDWDCAFEYKRNFLKSQSNGTGLNWFL